MPIYKMDGKKDGLQKYRVRINYTDNLGVQKQLDRVAYGKDAAKELEIRLMRDLKEETAKKITLGELVEEYLSMKRYKIRESSFDKIRRRLNYYVLPSLGGYRIDKLNTPILQKWKAEVEKMTKSTGERLSLRTKQSAYCELRAVLNYAVKMEYLPRNPLFATENFKDAYSTKKKIEFYTADEFLKFIARRLGHAKVEITWNTYSHLYPKEEDRAVTALNLITENKKRYKSRAKNVYTEKQTA